MMKTPPRLKCLPRLTSLPGSHVSHVSNVSHVFQVFPVSPPLALRPSPLASSLSPLAPLNTDDAFPM